MMKEQERKIEGKNKKNVERNKMKVIVKLAKSVTVKMQVRF